ncbi:DUF2330 domain-containing protein [candidate division WOR-3 bacterium]|nr:DUF2330 domain-containing protein [candidate division WOR-3 bacterium]
MKLIKYFIFFFLSGVSVFADRGSIPFEPYIKIFEPTQRAMIAWNGEEEILLLSTDMSASDTTEVLEVLPLPNEPVVKKGDVETFRKATDLINEKIRLQNLIISKRNGGKERGIEPAGKITFHEKIGAHDISVAHVLNKEGFIIWVEKYLNSLGVENPEIPEGLKKVVDEYLEENFTWFVFDVVSLDTEIKTNDAIQYRFKTDFLFYPVKIMNTEEGYTSMELLVLTPELLRHFPGIPLETIELPHQPISITSSELSELNEEMDELLEHKDNMKLRIWNIEGNISSFTEDLIAR